MAKTSPKGTAKSKDAGRRAVVEQMRREQQAKERRKTLLMIGAAVLVGAIIIGTAVWQLVREQAADGRELAAIGVPASEAGCQDVVTEDAAGEGEHRPPGEGISYEDAPPAFGPHWENALQPGEVRKFYTADDRPEVERLVHSLEHGWTILWYDDTVAGDETALTDLEGVADNFPDVTDREQKIIVAPWTADDGGEFPDDAHLALTHWSAGSAGQEGVWQYCSEVSGEVVADFMDEYPASDSPEGVNPQVF
ncbi:MAG: hypothetical protein AVDCRST_MAG36-1504 [uncultured Nocardioidaceae bacterium]|uniref:DUF3105 domain-containing protein n=1 Tax=uncultured Nocardioidaceae bacterium TaxID=253824 RepID=A0A6J4LVU9_9ACTN|nr:MAG: hypothetical protein AVDCRST_MAG36-1504 [uncultured Nocardioidaceae bacterium]